MRYTTRVVLPQDNAERAENALTARLQQMAEDDKTWPDWSTLSLARGAAVPDAAGRVLFEWIATVESVAEPRVQATRDATRRPTVSDLGLLRHRESD